MGLRGDAALVGYAQRRPSRHFAGTPRFSIEQWADLAADALADAGIDSREVDGICLGGDIAEAPMFSPATVAEYCGWSVNFAERLDLGGASAVGMVWRAAAAIELGLCEVVVCAATASPRSAAVFAVARASKSRATASGVFKSSSRTAPTSSKSVSPSPSQR